MSTPNETKAFAMYMSEIGHTQTLTKEQETELSNRIAQGDASAVDKLVTANLRLVVAIARKYSGRGLDMDDMVSEGNLGLMKAAIKYDAAKGNFASFAVPIICQTIEQAIGKQTSLYTIPKGEATAAEKKRSKALSVDAPLGHNNRNSLLSLLSDGNAPDAEQLLGDISAKSELEVVLNCLNERERAVITGFYGIGCEKLTFMEMAEQLDLKRERCRQIRKKALRKVKKELKRHEAERHHSGL